MFCQRWTSLRSKKSLLVSFAVHGLWLALAAWWTVRAARPAAPDAPPAFRAAPAPNRASLHALEHRVSLTRRRGGAPPVAHRALTTNLSQIALPAAPALPSLPFAQPAVLISGRHQEATGSLGTGREPGSGGDDGEDAGRALKILFTKLQVTEKRVGVVLDAATFHPPVANSDPAAQAWRRAIAAEGDYLERGFAPECIANYTVGGMLTPRSRAGGPVPACLGSAILNLVNSPRQFDAIYVLGWFGWITRQTDDDFFRRNAENDRSAYDDLWPVVQKRLRERKVKLYVHLVTTDDARPWTDPHLEEFFDFARSTGGAVKIGPPPRPGEEITAPSP